MGRRRGFFQTLAQEAAKAERAQRRRQRELLAQERASQRAYAATQQELEREHAQREADIFANTVELLLSVHHETSPSIDWSAIKAIDRPIASTVDVRGSKLAHEALEAYEPGFFERLFGLTGRWRRLETRLADALRAEKEQQERTARENLIATERWTQQNALASAVLAGAAEAYDQVLDESGCLEELHDLECKPTVRWVGPEIGHVQLEAPGLDAVVPVEEKNITARGKLTTKAMAAGKRWTIYQDFLCGAALRAARETLSVLPVEGVVVDVSIALLNSTTGHHDNSTVVSVYCPREAMGKINFVNADPSDVVESFKHSMKFTRSKGVAAVTPINPREVAGNRARS